MTSVSKQNIYRLYSEQGSCLGCWRSFPRSLLPTTLPPSPQKRLVGPLPKLKLTYVSASHTTASNHWLQATVLASSSELFSTKIQRVWASSLRYKFSQSLRLQRSWPSTTSYTEGSYATALGKSSALSALVLLLECSSTAIWLHSRFK